jgi:hypothetical protein
MMTQQPVFTLRCPVQSSLLASFGYCPLNCILDVEFRDGSLYRYYRVPLYICWNLLCADSKGRYFNRYVKAAFAYQRVSPPRRSVALRRCPRPRPRPGQPGLRPSANRSLTA